MIVSKDNPPNVTGDIIHSLERGLDPWHRDAFPEEFKDSAKGGVRVEGWFCLDWYGSVVGFIPDGFDFKEEE